MVDSNANSAPVPARPPTSDSTDEASDSSTSLEDAAVDDPTTDRCVTCEAQIGADDYRLSRVVETAVRTVQAHYCSEECFSSGSEGERATRTDGPRDFSYCR